MGLWNTANNHYINDLTYESSEPLQSYYPQRRLARPFQYRPKRNRPYYRRRYMNNQWKQESKLIHL